MPIPVLSTSGLQTLFAAAYLDELKKMTESYDKHGPAVIPADLDARAILEDENLTNRILEEYKTRKSRIVTAAFKKARQIVEDLAGEINVDKLTKEEARDWFTFCVEGSNG